MEQADDLRLTQAAETATTVVQRARFAYRYAYARSADTRIAEDVGQDYLIVRDNDSRIAFAVCDGVSQSFQGDLAANILGNALVEWLWQEAKPTSDSSKLQERLTHMLRALSEPATEAVYAAVLPTDLPEMLHEVLEQKRAGGSESTFVAGLLDTDFDWIVLVWMGDSRIRLWDSRGQITTVLGDTFLTRERWSTKHGPVGKVHIYTTKLVEISRLALYSDGLAVLDNQLEQPLEHTQIDDLIAMAGDLPSSDDIAFLELTLAPNWQHIPVPSRLVRVHPKPTQPKLRNDRKAAAWTGDHEPRGYLPPLLAPRSVSISRADGRLQVRWMHVAGAESYVVCFSDNSRESPNTVWRPLQPPLLLTEKALPDNAEWVHVRAVRGASYGPWSEGVAVPRLRLLDAIIDSINANFQIWIAIVALLMALIIITSPPVWRVVQDVVVQLQTPVERHGPPDER
jgi:hypothetical protein